MIKAIILDFDGTMIDSMNFWHNFASLYFKYNNYIVEDYERLNSLFKTYNDKEQAIFINKYHNNEMTVDEIVTDMYDFVIMHHLKSIKLKKGILKLIKFLKENSYKICICTESYRIFVDQYLQQHNLHQYIDCIFCANEFNTNKRISCLIYDEALKYLNMNKSDVLVIEDALYALKTLKQNSYKSVAIYDEYNNIFKDDLILNSDLYINDGLELIDYIKKLT
ncbi:MAG: HAD family hydrolase [Anaeroplasmataceae bacterium]